MGSREMLSSVFHFPAGITIDSIDPGANELVIRIAVTFPVCHVQSATSPRLASIAATNAWSPMCLVRVAT